MELGEGIRQGSSRLMKKGVSGKTLKRVMDMSRGARILARTKWGDKGVRGGNGTASRVSTRHSPVCSCDGCADTGDQI